MVSLYMDQHVPRAITIGLRLRGIDFIPNVAKTGGLQRQGVKGVVVTLPRSLDNAVSEVLRLSQRVNDMPKSA